MFSICDLVPIGLAAALSEREEAGSVLDRLEHQISLVTTTGRARCRGPAGPGAAARLICSPTCSARAAAGGRAARGGRPLVGRSGRAGTRPRARRRRPRPGPADRAAAPLRHPADPRRGPRAAAPGAGQGRRTPPPRPIPGWPCAPRWPISRPGNCPRCRPTCATHDRPGRRTGRRISAVLRAVAEQLGAGQRGDRAADPAPFVIAEVAELPAEPGWRR